MKRGWFGQSRRHRLAARGIKTSIDKSQMVNKVNWDRYRGDWYEHSRYPNDFQDEDCFAKASYTKDPEGGIKVVNKCGDNKIEGHAIPIAKNTLGVRFFWFGSRSPYKVEYVDPSYQYAIVGHPEKKFLWILSRYKKITPEKLESLKQIAKKKSYSVSKLKEKDDL